MNKGSVVRTVKNKRLAYYVQSADPEMWDRHWHQHFDPRILKGAAAGKLVTFYERPFTRWLPRDGRVIEAGCGFGHIVMALHARGYDVEGVDFARQTVDLVKTRFPDLPIRHGDATCLGGPDGRYAGYISLGVVEHHEEGPEVFLREAWRVLAPGGIAIFTVPWFNAFRRWKARFGLYGKSPGGLSFYQYAFARDEFLELLKAAGFAVVDHSGFDTIKGLKDEVPWVGNILKWRFVGWRLHRALGRLFAAAPRLAGRLDHMLLVVARKPDK